MLRDALTGQEMLMTIRLLLALVLLLVGITARIDAQQTGSGATGQAPAASAHPFKLITVVRVSDFDTWYRGFKSGEPSREATGGQYNPQVFRDPSDAHRVSILFDVDDIAKARAYLSSASFLERARSVGAIGTPEIYVPVNSP